MNSETPEAEQAAEVAQAETKTQKSNKNTTAVNVNCALDKRLNRAIDRWLETQIVEVRKSAAVRYFLEVGIKQAAPELITDEADDDETVDDRQTDLVDLSANPFEGGDNADETTKKSGRSKK